ncbi:MAG: S-layer homology domain-containing protein [Bacillota bacterium]
MALIIARALKEDTTASSEVSFTDAGQVSTLARAAVAAITREKIILGYPDGTFRPKANTTRAQAVTVILRALKAKAN